MASRKRNFGRNPVMEEFVGRSTEVFDYSYSVDEFTAEETELAQLLLQLEPRPCHKLIQLSWGVKRRRTDAINNVSNDGVLKVEEINGLSPKTPLLFDNNNNNNNNNNMVGVKMGMENKINKELQQEARKLEVVEETANKKQKLDNCGGGDPMVDLALGLGSTTQAQAQVQAQAQHIASVYYPINKSWSVGAMNLNICAEEAFAMRWRYNSTSITRPASLSAAARKARREKMNRKSMAKVLNAVEFHEIMQ